MVCGYEEGKSGVRVENMQMYGLMRAPKEVPPPSCVEFAGKMAEGWAVELCV